MRASLMAIVCLFLIIIVGGFRPKQYPTSEDNLALEQIIAATNDDRVLLSLRNLGLTEIPPEIGQLTQLKVLDLSENQLDNLPNEISNLTNLDRLHLSYNSFVSIPPEVTNLTNLKSLWVDNNNIARVSPAMGQLLNLEKLYLDGNVITSIPNEIGNLRNLRVLSLTYNDLATLPTGVGSLRDLCYLNFGYNRFRQLPEILGVFHTVPNHNHCEHNIFNLIVEPNPYDSDEETTSLGTSAILQSLHIQMRWHEVLRISSFIFIFTLVIIQISILLYRLRDKRKRKLPLKSMNFQKPITFISPHILSRLGSELENFQESNTNHEISKRVK